MGIEKLNFEPVIENQELVARSTLDVILNWDNEAEKELFLVSRINPQYMNGIDLCNKYGVESNCGANCLIVQGKRKDIITNVALIVPVGYKYNMSSVVRKYLDARIVSVAPLEFVIRNTGMEYGSINPVGIPKDWKILIDSLVLKQEYIIMGSGLQNSKMKLPSKFLLKLPNSVQLEGIAKVTEE